MSNFSGKYYYSIDPKGRVMIPAPLREIISATYGPRLYLTNSPVDPCLQVFPQEEWAALLDKVRTLPRTHKSVKRFMRDVVGSAVELEIDKQGRIQVPASLREDSGLTGEIVVLGQLDRIEIWDRRRWDEAMDASKLDAGAYESDLSGFGL